MKNTKANGILFALLGDLHLGVKHDDTWTEGNILKFFQWFCADCKKKNVRTLLQAGDWFDVRRGITQRTMEFFREEIVPLLEETFDDVYVIVGNHDMHLKDFVSPNSCREVLGQYDFFHVIEEPTTIDVGVKVDMIPWLCKSNSQQIFDFIKESDSPYCVGHWELSGYYFYKGMKSTGDDPEFLEKYKNVWSGHFHTISSGGNVQYLGTPYTITLGDANDPRGYWLYDSKSAKIEFNQNPITHHHKVYFDADTWKHTADELDKLYSDKTVKLIIEKSHSDVNKVNIDRVLDDMERICHEFGHEYTEESITNSIDPEDADEVKSDLDIAREQICLLDETQEIKDRVGKIFVGLYAEVNAQ